MNIKTLFSDNLKLVLEIDGTNPSYINALRRTILSQIPILAIEKVTFRKNESILYDEMLALRLGLTPLKTNLDDFNLKSVCKCGGEGCARCEIKLTLSAKGPCTVYAKDLVCEDSSTKVAFDKIQLVKLDDNQSLELEATAQLGLGKDHVKWSPALAFYSGYPEFIVTKDSNVNAIIEKYPSVVELKSKKLVLKDFLKFNGAFEDFCEENKVSIKFSETKYVLTIESFGQIPPKEVFQRAIKSFDNLLDEFNSVL